VFRRGLSGAVGVDADRKTRPQGADAVALLHGGEVVGFDAASGDPLWGFTSDQRLLTLHPPMFSGQPDSVFEAVVRDFGGLARFEVGDGSYADRSPKESTRWLGETALVECADGWLAVCAGRESWLEEAMLLAIVDPVAVFAARG